VTDTEAVSTLELVNKLWPKTRDAWPEEVQTEFMIACERIRIDWQQADAAIKALSMRSKFATVKPVEVLEALRGAIARVTEQRKAQASHTLQADLEAATTARLLNLPEHLRHEVLLRIDQNLPPVECRGATAENLEKSARIAESGDWAGAMEWPLFRYEAKHTPAVKAWLRSEG